MALHLKAHKVKYEREVCLVAGRQWRFDFWFPDAGIAVEVEGGTKFGKSRHSRGDGFEEDCRKYNAASLAGIRLLRFTTRQVKSGEAVDTIRKALQSPRAFL